jgi:hypothetical protein
MIKSRKLIACIALFAGAAILNACDNDSPEIYGNDGAALANVDLSNAVALIASIDNNSTFNYEGYTFKRQTLYKIDAGGGLNPATFTISGNQNGGFDWYSVNDLDASHFLISFYRRKETYIVDKTNGVAAKTAFMEIDDLTLEETKGFALSEDGSLYFRDIHDDHLLADNILSTSAGTTEQPGINGLPEEWFFDSQGALYFADEDKLFFYNNGVATQIATNSPMNLWNDLDGVLRMIDSNGKIYVLANGSLINDGETGIPLTSTRFRTFAFPHLGKLLAIFTSFTGPTLLYDLKNRQTITSIETGDEYFDIAGSDSFGDFITLVNYRGTQLELLKIDVSAQDPVTLTIQLNALEPVNRGGVYAVSETMTLLEIETSSSSTPFFKYENSEGVLKQLHTDKVYGNVVKLVGF